MQPLPQWQRPHGEVDVEGIGVREAEDARGAVGTAAVVTGPEALQQGHLVATCGQPPCRRGTHGATTDDDNSTNRHS